MEEVNLFYSYGLDRAQTTGKVPLKMRGFIVKIPCCESKTGHPDPCCIHRPPCPPPPPPSVCSTD